MIFGWITLLWSIPWLVYIRGLLGRRYFIVLFVFIVLLQGLWGITQFIVQRNLSLSEIGESVLAPSVAGVAKFNYRDIGFISPTESGENFSKIIRAYGPYPHSNSLAGSLILALGALFLLAREHRSRLWSYAGYFLMLALLVTFSRTAWAMLAGLIICCWLVAYYQHRRSWHGFINGFMALTLITLLLFTPLIWLRVTDSQDRGVTDRLSGWQTAVEIIGQHNWWEGSGLGRYDDSLRNLLQSEHYIYEPWQIEPVHSTGLLIIAEQGVLAFVFWLVLVGWLLNRYYRKTWPWLLPLLGLLAFDHYFITQGGSAFMLVAWLVGLANYPRRELTTKRVRPQNAL